MADGENTAEDLVILTHGRTALAGNLRQIKAGYGTPTCRSSAQRMCFRWPRAARAAADRKQNRRRL